MKTAHIHISVPDSGEFHVGPFGSLADASCCVAKYPETLKLHCTVSDSHPIVGTVFSPETPAIQLMEEMQP